ncbi:hypothetical protein NSU_0744 [Novosphingobium pentaromativorans US6-1]|uniref:Uncharacterized protein n=1 Tax=Novosphingobium pentaromativorans US6-1 TaxID=1088721 RepID=G6E8S3_9SPHN|nr:hypothetical protein NSU_0744 [Novosphingobium pentaromativorans US6-1]
MINHLLHARRDIQDVVIDIDVLNVTIATYLPGEPFVGRHSPRVTPKQILVANVENKSHFTRYGDQYFTASNDAKFPRRNTLLLDSLAFYGSANQVTLTTKLFSFCLAEIGGDHTRNSACADT